MARRSKCSVLAAVAIVLIIVSIFAASAQTVPLDQKQPTSAETSTLQPRAATSAPSIPVQEPRWYDTFFTRSTDWLLVLFNGILAAFTIRLFYAARDQSRSMRAAVAEAARSADAAEKTFTTLERPYLFIFGSIPCANPRFEESESVRVGIIA
jgi:hypothetical protein